MDVSSARSKFVSSQDTMIEHKRFGCVTTAQLVAVGLSRSAIAKRAVAGRLRRMHKGVYFEGAGEPTYEQRCAAALLAVGEDGALDGLGSAVIRGWWKRTPCNDIRVICGRRLQNPDINVQFSRHWDPKMDICVVNGLRMVRPERLVLNLGRQLTHYQLTNIVKEASFWNCFDRKRFKREVERLNSPSGSMIASRAVASYHSGCVGTRSALEDRMIALLSISGFPLPDEAGMPIGPHEVDLVWLDRGLIVEVDGPGHRQPNSRRKDPARDADLCRAGFEVIRFTNFQIDYDPYAVTAQLNRYFM